VLMFRSTMKKTSTFDAALEPISRARRSAQIARLTREYSALLKNPSSTEQTVQDFLERHSDLIPVPWLLNHGLHLGVMISKFPLDTSLVTDLAYLTKSTMEWYAVFVELEHPAKRIFTENKKSPRFSADFNAALGQIEDWRLFVESHDVAVRDRLSPLLRPLSKNRVRFKYVLVYGRNSELGSNQERIDRFAALNNHDRRVLTYDSLARGLRTRGGHAKNILSPTRRAFKLKHLNLLWTAMFSLLYSHELEVSNEHSEKLRAAGYQLDRWKKGLRLRVNHKYPDAKAFFKSDEFKQYFPAKQKSSRKR
jgi:hypothetical protein